MLKYKPKYFFLYGVIIYFLLYFFGPYEFTLYSIKGVIYYLLAMFLFACGLQLGNIRFGKFNNQYKQYEKIKSSKSIEIYLFIAELIAGIFFLIYISEVLQLTGASYKFGSDLRIVLSESRSFLNKISEIGMYISIACFLIIESLDIKSRLLLNISNIFFWLPSLAMLLIGARWDVFVSILVFFTSKGYRRRNINKKIKPKKKWKKFLAIFLFAVFLIIILGLVYKLFQSRGMVNATEEMLMYPGDIALKPFYLELYKLSKGLVDPIYKIFLYFTHSMPFFTWLFENNTFSQTYHGAYLFRSVGFICNAIGISFPDYKTIIASQSFSGYYSTFIGGYLIDFGKIGSLIMIFLTGTLFDKLSLTAKKSKYADSIVPVILVMCLIAPIYYFWHMGSIDFILIEVTFLFLGIAILNKLKKVFIMEGNMNKEIIITWSKVKDVIKHYWWLSVIVFLVFLVPVLSNFNNVGSDTPATKDLEGVYTEAVTMILLKNQEMDNKETRDGTYLANCQSLVRSSTMKKMINESLMEDGYEMLSDEERISLEILSSSNYGNLIVEGKDEAKIKKVANLASTYLLELAKSNEEISDGKIIDDAYIRKYTLSDNGEKIYDTINDEIEDPQVVDSRTNIGAKSILLIFVGIFISLGLLVVMILLDRKIRTPNEVETYFKLKCIGRITNKRELNDKLLVLMDHIIKKNGLSDVICYGDSLNEAITEGKEKKDYQIRCIDFNETDNLVNSIESSNFSTFLTIRSGRHSLNELEDIINYMELLDINIIGVVLIDKRS